MRTLGCILRNLMALAIVVAQVISPAPRVAAALGVSIGSDSTAATASVVHAPLAASATIPTLAPTASASSCRSLQLNGISAHAEASTASDLNLLSDWTLETWFKDESPLGFNHDYVNLINKGDREANAESPYFVSLGYKRLVAGLRSKWSDQTVAF